MASAAQKYFTLGVETYDNLPNHQQLKRAVLDAKRVKTSFVNLGYDGVNYSNLSRSQFYKRWEDFLDTLEPEDTVIFFFSGHGIEIDGQNYLLPRDVDYPQYSKRSRVRRDAIKLSELITDLSKANYNGISIFILDACRDDPFLPNEFKGQGIGSNGLANVNAPDGTFIMYSSSAGKSSLDRLPNNDSDSNSVYTRHLVKIIDEKKYNIAQAAREIRKRVRNTTASVGFVQSPAYYDGMSEDFCFHGCGNIDKKRDEPEQAPIDISTTISSRCFETPDGCLNKAEAKEYAQDLLMEAGCYNGALDGKFGPKTFAALESFNEINNQKLTLESDLELQNMISVMFEIDYLSCDQVSPHLSEQEQAIVNGDPRQYLDKFIRGMDGRSKSGEFHTWAFSYRNRSDAEAMAAEINIKYPSIRPIVAESFASGVTWWGVALATWTTSDNAILVRDLARKLDISIDAYIRKQKL